MNTVIIAKSVSELLISEYLASYQLEMARNPGKFDDSKPKRVSTVHCTGSRNLSCLSVLPRGSLKLFCSLQKVFPNCTFYSRANSILIITLNFCV